MADNNSKLPTPPSSSRTTMVMVVILLAVAFFVGSQFMRTGAMGTTVTDQLITSEFTQAVEQGRVKSVTYSAGDYTVSGTYFPAVTAGATAADAFNSAFDAMNALMATVKDADGKSLAGVGTTTLDPATLGKEHNYTSTYVGSDSLGELLAAHPDISYQVTLPSPFLEIIATLLPILIIGGLLFFFFFKMQQANNSQMNFGKAKTKKAAEERPDVKFSDVAGVDEAVEEMQEIKDFLANPAKYQSMGAKIPRGCLLVGPPGTGKTLLARAVAGEAGVPFFSISGSDFVEMFVGVGASRVRDLFQQAKDAAPAIIFIDEIDAVGRQRGTGLGGGHDEREQTLNQLLVEMDGFESNDSVVLIAATNRADVLDPALLRPGRFDRQIVVDTPDVKGREKILTVHAKDKPIGSDVDLNKIAKITPGFTGADLANLMNESALLTARRGKKIITMREVSESMERVIAGPERKGRVMNEKTKHTIAYHESGHALVGHLLDHADPVHKISIISRGRALGYTLSIPDEDKVLNSLSEMKDELAVFMGGRVAEEIFCDDVTTGASNDLERASKMARAIVTQYGMSPLGTQVFGQPNHEVFLGRDYGNTQDYSEETARRIDEEVAKIMKEAHDRAHKILADHADQMDLMASVLLERETVEGEACEALLDNKWDEYLAREDEIIAAKEAEEAAARAKDAEMLAAQGDGEGAQAAAASSPDAGETLADPNWRREPVEPGDQDPNAPYRPAAEGADRADMPTQAEVDAEIDREDEMDSSADAPDSDKRD
ncbi:ATP-dependent zinc metalloprotease FtsH [Adlercreutzia muris]|uniref:ATP-dependent zinc metalloprotease FtsH n=1 Tax=Adlercreutzia muris TaxID=1796610 RepID=UPI001F5A71B7|nr:ATP-dependent zinc metalloprotease FtsH [Adlercreutzia muris]